MPATGGKPKTLVKLFGGQGTIKMCIRDRVQRQQRDRSGSSIQYGKQPPRYMPQKGKAAGSGHTGLLKDSNSSPAYSPKQYFLYPVRLYPAT